MLIGRTTEGNIERTSRRGGRQPGERTGEGRWERYEAKLYRLTELLRVCGRSMLMR
jgi:hypothetical protein